MKFTEVEINTILTLINNNIEKGWYYGNKEQYFTRLNKIKMKFESEQPIHL